MRDRGLLQARGSEDKPLEDQGNEAFEQIRRNVGHAAEIRDLAGTRIAAVAGVEDLVAGRVCEQPIRRAVPKNAAVLFVLVGIDKPCFRLRAVLAGDDMADGVDVEFDEFDGPGREGP